MLLKAAIKPRVVSERGLQRTPRSKSDFALGLDFESCHDAQVGALPLLSVWFEACAEHLHLHIFQGWR
jgi:hypothetical protein